MLNSPKVGFVSLGCPKALVDSEQIINRLRAEAYEISASYAGADLVIVNTCGFIDSAAEESLDAIAEALAENGKVIVTGCLGARGNLVIDAHPAVLAVTGPNALDEVMAQVHKYLPKPHNPFVDLLPKAAIKLTPKHYAYLKISEGCNHACSFCIIPSLRGKLVSRPIHQVLQEASELAKSGVKELLLVSQDTSAYGLDVKYKTGFYQGRPVKTRLTELCRELAKLGIWLRLHYVYPYPKVDELVELMAEGLLLPYLDVPFQHASPKILKAMLRPASSENMLERIRVWREICPDICLRSTFIVGFPGETEDDFQQLLDFLSAAKLDRVGCFAYSDVDGAPANVLDNKISEDIKQQRLERLMNLQAQISTDLLQQKIGRRIRVLVDEVDSEQNGIVCRSFADAPQIDGYVYVDDCANVSIGDLLDVEVIDADEHDLWAKRL